MQSYVAAVALACCVLLPMLAQPGAALRCWVCSSSTDPRCQDPFNSTRVQQVDCDAQRPYGDHTYCQKTVTSISGGVPKVVRKCVYSRDPLSGGCTEQAPNSDHLSVDHCSTCQQDLCNGAPAPAPAATGPAAALALAVAWATARLLR